MLRARHKLLKYIVVIIPLAFIFLSPFSDSLRQRFFNRYDLRWHTRDNPKLRVQEITVHNNGDAPIGKIRVHLVLNPASKNSVADFAFTKFRSGHSPSFLDSAASADLLKEKELSDEMKPVAAALDTQREQRTLYSIERALDEVGMSKIRKNANTGITLKDPKNPGTSLNWDESLKGTCDGKESPDALCEKALEIVTWWKGLKRHFAEQARKSWSERAGVDVIYPTDQFSPASYADFTFGLEARETGSLQISYNTDPNVAVGAGVEVISSSVRGQANRVEDKADLDAPFAVFMWEYHFPLLAAVLSGIFIVLRFAWPEIRPKQLLSINRVVHTALNTDDHEYWEHVYQRYRFYILQQFREYRRLHDKPHLDPQPEELLDYVRAQLITAHHQNPARFKAKRLKTEARLNRFICARLHTLVILSA